MAGLFSGLSSLIHFIYSVFSAQNTPAVTEYVRIWRQVSNTVVLARRRRVWELIQLVVLGLVWI